LTKPRLYSAARLKLNMELRALVDESSQGLSGRKSIEAHTRMCVA
jgi:hypothetical protein